MQVEVSQTRNPPTRRFLGLRVVPWESEDERARYLRLVAFALTHGYLSALAALLALGLKSGDLLIILDPLVQLIVIPLVVVGVVLFLPVVRVLLWRTNFSVSLPIVGCAAVVTGLATGGALGALAAVPTVLAAIAAAGLCRLFARSGILRHRVDARA